MKSDGKNLLIKRDYNTEDIVNLVVDTCNKNWHSVSDVAKTLRGHTEYETCRNIWQYCIDNARYKEDGFGVQLIKTPARLFADGEGDCKSFAIFCASCCQCLGIKCYLRFVSFGSDEVKHVYVFTESGINIDPVEYFQNKKDFNEVTQFTYKMDKPITSGLAVLSGIKNAAGIGATEEPFRIWMDGTDFITNTRAANYLLTAIDLQLALIASRYDDLEAINKAALLVVAYRLYKVAHDDDAKLYRAASIMQRLSDEGRFDKAYIEDEDVDAYLGDTITDALNLLGGVEIINEVGDVYEWFVDSIIKEDENGLTKSEIKKWRSIFDKGSDEVGDVILTDDKKNELIQKMQESSSYFLYLFITDAQVKRIKKIIPEIVAKREIERNVYNSWKTTFAPVFSEATIKNTLLAGFVKTTGRTPEQFIIDCESERNNNNVGSFIAIFTAIAAVIVKLAIVAAVIVGVCKLCEMVKDADETIRFSKQSELELQKAISNGGDGAPEDYEIKEIAGLLGNNNNTSGSVTAKSGASLSTSEASSSMLPVLLIGAAILFLARKK